MTQSIILLTALMLIASTPYTAAFTPTLDTFLPSNGLIVLGQDVPNSWNTINVQRQNPTVTFVTIEENDLPILTQEYGINHLPDLLFIKDGTVVYSLCGQGPLTSSLQELIDAYLL